MTIPGTPRWYHHIPPASALVPCGGEQHRLTWRRGKLVLEDHDLDAERAMLVLGGEPCACLLALRFWRDQFVMPPELFSQMYTWLGPKAVLAPPELGLPRQLGMTLSWDRAWRRSSYLDKHGRLLGDQLRERGLAAFRRHLGVEKQRFGSRVLSSAQVEALPASQEATVKGQMDKVAVRASALLHGSWLVDVWPRAMAVVDGAFVVEIVEDSFVTPLVRATRWVDRPGGTRVPVVELARLHRPPDPSAGDGEAPWELTWGAEQVP